MTKKVKSEQEEIGLKGEGVERLVIPEIESAAKVYVKHRDERMELLEDELKYKKKLIEAMHEFGGGIPRDKNGEIVYRVKDLVITLKPGKEDVKVKEVGTPVFGREKGE